MEGRTKGREETIKVQRKKRRVNEKKQERKIKTPNVSGKEEYNRAERKSRKERAKKKKHCN